MEQQRSALLFHSKMASEQDFEDIDMLSNESLTLNERFQKWIESLNLLDKAHHHVLWLLDVATIKITVSMNCWK